MGLKILERMQSIKDFAMDNNCIDGLLDNNCVDNLLDNNCIDN